jgi:hypothetical protein
VTGKYKGKKIAGLYNNKKRPTKAFDWLKNSRIFTRLPTTPNMFEVVWACISNLYEGLSKGQGNHVVILDVLGI